MMRPQSQLPRIAGRFAAIGGALGVVAGVAQATLGSHIPYWTGNKAQPAALGLLTIALSASVYVAVRALRATTRPRDETLTAVVLWLVFVAAVCATTTGRLWLIPGAFLLIAAGVTLVGCGVESFRAAVASNWLRGLLGLLGAFELLMAVSAAPVVTLAAGLLAGGALIAAAVLCVPGQRTLMIALVALTVPFAALTWWTIVTPLITVVALAIGLATTSRHAHRSGRPVAAA